MFYWCEVEYILAVYKRKNLTMIQQHCYDATLFIQPVSLVFEFLVLHWVIIGSTL